MADNRNDKQLDQGKRPVFELRIPKKLDFVFGVDEVYSYDKSTILAGQIFQGKIVPGAIVSYGEIGPKKEPRELFACFVSNIQVPNEQTKTMETVQSASRNGVMGGRCALVITERDAKFFQPGGIVFTSKEQK